jgi:protein-S-isoprenylcysteine O-methyltransferase Ste14
MAVNLFGLIVNGVVIAGMAYLAFAMALAGWIAGLRRGEAVTLLPVCGGGTATLAAQLGLVLVALIACAALIYWLWIPLPLAVPPAATPILAVVGLVIFVAGALFVVWARRTLGRMWGISTSRQPAPAAPRGPGVKLLPDHQLIAGGPYALVRHPMYFGWWVALLGALLVYRTWILALLLVMSLAAFYRRARLEEATLGARFGAEWQAYVERAKFLIPFIH